LAPFSHTGADRQSSARNVRRHESGGGVSSEHASR